MNLLQKLVQRAPVLKQYDAFRGSLHHLELTGEVSNRMKFKGKEQIVWCNNDYLGLMNHPESKKAATLVTEKYGPSYPHSVRLTTGHTADHDHLEKTLSSFLGREESMLVNLGYQGFMSILDALTDRHDTIIYDQKCHACLIDGVRLHNGRKFAFKHNNIAHLELQLKRAIKSHHPDLGILLVVVDGLYSMHGDLAPLDEIARMKEKYNFILFVDDSHGFGVFGQNGRGTAEHFGVENSVDIYLSTFTKAFGNLGGFVSAKKEIIDYLRFSVRSQIFSRTLPLAMVKSVQKNLEIFFNEPERRTQLWDNTFRFHKGLRDIGINIGNCVGPIISIEIKGSHQDGLGIYFGLRDLGIFSYIVAYPVVDRDSCLIRLVCTYNHTKLDIDQTLDAFNTLKNKYPMQLLGVRLLV